MSVRLSRCGSPGPGGIGNVAAQDRCDLGLEQFPGDGVIDTGCRWRDLPSQLGIGSRRTAWRRLRAWQAAGVWDRLQHRVLDELAQAHVLDWSRASIDAVSARAKRGAS